VSEPPTMELPLDLTPLSTVQVATLSAIQEGHFHDRKSIQISPAKLTKAMSAFANADGGELLVGIEDDGSWVGAKDVEAFNGHLQAMEPLFPYGSEFGYEFYQHPTDGSVVLAITVQKSRDIRFATNGTAYLRRGAQSLPVADLDELRMKKGLSTHETATLRYDTDQIANSETIIGFMLNVVPDAEPDKWLRKQNVIVDGLPTVAGTLLFHDEPQIHLPKAAVKLYRYSTSDAEGSREHLAYTPITIEGSLYDVIAKAVAETARQVEEMPVLEKGAGLRNVRYPQETLHEIITNALIHRDYAVNDDVHVRIFENRIEVLSPGSLPANITPRNILDERFSRNPMIVRLLNKFPDPPNKDVGEGLNTAFAAMRNLELRDPEIVDTGTSVIVVIRHESLAAPEARIVEYLKANGSINNREARVLLNKPEADRSIRRLFEKLVEAEMIERVPGTNRGGSRYRLLEDAYDSRDSEE
jgi:ATP-dependent DNA helicase RecG